VSLLFTFKDGFILKVDEVCSLESFRRFLILSTCKSFIPSGFFRDQTVFPERPREQGTMYVEAEDKQTLGKIRNIQFFRVTNVLGIIYNSMSGRTMLKWRSIKKEFGKISGEASLNTLVNLYASDALKRPYIEKSPDSGEDSREGRDN
jgi:hypothetical protein